MRRGELFDGLWRRRRLGKLNLRLSDFRDLEASHIRRFLNLVATQLGCYGSGNGLFGQDRALQQPGRLFDGHRRNRMEIKNVFFRCFQQWSGGQTHQCPEHDANDHSFKKRTEAHHRAPALAIFLRRAQQAEARHCRHTSTLLLAAPAAIAIFLRIVGLKGKAFLV